MSVKLQIYLDTSVFCAYFDERVPERQAETIGFWKNIGQFEASTSELTRQEMGETPSDALRNNFQSLLAGFTLHIITDEMRELAQRYIRTGVFTPVMYNDALHVAAAVITRTDVLLSWNFKHLVNRRRRVMVNQLNTMKGLPPIEILASPEI